MAQPQPCPGILGGSGDRGGSCQPCLGLSWVLQTALSPLLLPRELPQALGRAGAFVCRAGCSAAQCSTWLGSDCASPGVQSLWVVVIGSWGVCTGVPKRLEPHGWPAGPFIFASAEDGSPVTGQDPGLGPRAVVRAGGTRGTRWGRGAASAEGTSVCPQPADSQHSPNYRQGWTRRAPSDTSHPSRLLNQWGRTRIPPVPCALPCPP